MKVQAVTRVVLRNVLPMVAGLIVLVLGIALLAGFFETKIPPGETPIEARRLGDRESDVVHEVTKEYTDEAVGTLKSSSRTVIAAKILATISEITVAAGDEAQQGQVLVRLASEELNARLRQAEQSLLAVEARRREAESAFRRAQQLQAQRPGVITQERFDEISRRVEVARADEVGAQQAVHESTVLLSYTTIEAPQAGRIVDRFAEPGDMARPGEPLLVLYDARSLRLEAPVAERLKERLKPGQKINVRIGVLERDVEGTIDEIVPQVAVASRSFLVKVALPPSDDLYEGMFGRLLIPAGVRRHLCLPTSSLVEIGQLQFVDVVAEDGTLERRLVKTGQLGMPGRVEVLSGLRDGDRVVLYSNDADAAQDKDAPGDE